MRHVVIAFLAGLAALVTIGSGIAQTATQPTSAPPSAAPPPAAPASAGPPVAEVTPTAPLPKAATPADARQDIKGVRETCHGSAKSEGLQGEAMRKAVSDCVVKIRPDLAGRE